MNGMIPFFMLTFLLSFIEEIYPGSYEKAAMLAKHGLKSDAKTELIDVLFGGNPAGEKAKAYYLLGTIAFDENRISTVLETWRELSIRHPNSREALLVKDRIQELAEIVGDFEEESLRNAVAQSYLRHGDFWSRGKSNSFMIDASWISHIESAIKWYDKVITEFPSTRASRIAYEAKIMTLLGWEDRGQYGAKYGIKRDFNKYMPHVLQAFASFCKGTSNGAVLASFSISNCSSLLEEKELDKDTRVVQFYNC